MGLTIVTWRRRVLPASFVLGLAGLAACGSDGGDDEGKNADDAVSSKPGLAKDGGSPRADGATVTPLGTSDAQANEASAPVPPISGTTAISVGASYTCALHKGGVRCWGNNVNGMLGNGSNVDSHVPVPVSGLGSGVVSVVTGDHHACALTTAGGVKCWGRGVEGQLGTGAPPFVNESRVPVDVLGLSSGVTAIAAGADHTCALTSTGAVWCWGDNAVHQLGDDGLGPPSSGTPRIVSGLGPGVVSIAAGSAATAVVMSDGRLKTWGGGFGGGSIVGPTDVVGLTSGVAAVSIGASHLCVVTTAKRVKCLGRNDDGQLGDGTLLPFGGQSSALNDVVNLTSVLSVSVGWEYSCAVTSAGTANCWGIGDSGVLGNNNANDRSLVPVTIVKLGFGARSISASNSMDHTCAVTTTGAMCWGKNTYGQLGDGSTTSSLVPIAVLGL